MSYSAAISAWEDVRSRRDAGEDPVLSKKSAKTVSKKSSVESYTVRQLCEDFIAGHIERHRTALGARQTRTRMLAKIAPIADLSAASITRGQAFALLEGESGSPRNAAILRAELGAAWDHALDADRIPDNTPNWWRQVMRGKLRSAGRSIDGEKQLIKRVLTADELKVLIPWLPTYPSTTSDVLTLYLWTCLRGGELVMMEGREVSEEQDGLWWTIPKAKTKNKNRKEATDHRVPLVGRAEKIVRDRIEEFGDSWLFPTNTNSHIPQRSINKIVWAHHSYSQKPNAIPRAVCPVGRWAPHDLRRTSRTLLAALGCPREVAESLLGHILPGVEGIYNRHKYDAEKREWLMRLSDRLETLARAKDQAEED
jgi:integrase